MTSVEHTAASEPPLPRKTQVHAMCPKTHSHMGGEGNFRPRTKPSMIVPNTAQNINIYSKETAEGNLFKVFLPPPPSQALSFVSNPAALGIFHASCVLQ